MTRTPHDALIRFAAADAKVVEVQRLIEWSTLELQPGTFISPELRATHSDLLFRVKLASRDAFIYVLFEHQSRSDPWMALRMLGYVTDILRRFRTEQPEATKLPLVIPRVLHHGKDGWTAATSLHELWDANAETLDAVGDYVPKLRFLLDDLAKVSEQELRQRDAVDLALLVLLLLQQLRGAEDPVALLTRWVSHLERVHSLPNAADALRAIWVYTLSVGQVAPDELVPLVRRLGVKAEEGLMTGAEILRKEGEARGRAEGEARGRAEVLLRQLRLRFGHVRAEHEARIRAATSDELDRWAELVLLANTLDEFGL